MIAILRNAGDKGLAPDDYDSPRWPARLGKLKPATGDPTESDLVRFRCCTDDLGDAVYFRPAHRPSKSATPGFWRRCRRTKIRLAGISARECGSRLERLSRSAAGRTSLSRLSTNDSSARKIPGNRAARTTVRTLPAIKKPIKPGDSYPGVPRLARLLRLVGDLPDRCHCCNRGHVYQGALVNAVKSFQQRHGLTPDGQIDARNPRRAERSLEPPSAADGTHAGTLALAAGRIPAFADRSECSGVPAPRL